MFEFRYFDTRMGLYSDDKFTGRDVSYLRKNKPPRPQPFHRRQNRKILPHIRRCTEILPTILPSTVCGWGAAPAAQPCIIPERCIMVLLYHILCRRENSSQQIFGHVQNLELSISELFMSNLSCFKWLIYLTSY